jgi:starch-binding outer membrane protein, SusD/RagB family
MFKVKFLKLMVLFVMMLFVGCHDDLNERVFSSVTEETVTFTADDFESVFGPVYSNLRGLHGFHNYFTQEITTDEMVQPANASGWDDGGIFRRMHQHSWTAEQPHVSALWNTLQQGVLHSNRILRNFNEGRIELPSGVNSESFRSEIRTARAFYYWLIMDNFGDAPLLTDIDSPSDIPGKTAREDIYQFVVNELVESIPQLSEETGGEMYGRFNKWAAKTVLASVYLNAEVYTGTAQWDAVIQETDKIISSGRFQLEQNYSEPFRVNIQNSIEVIFAIPFDQTNGPGFNIATISFHEALRNRFRMQSTPWGAGSAKAVPQFADTYDEDDLRLDKTWLRGLQYSADGEPLLGAYERAGEHLNLTRTMRDGVFTAEDAGYRIGKWEIEEGATANLNNDYALFRYARVLMMQAEALLRTGRASDAAEIVTDVRLRAFEDPGAATVTASDLQSDTQYEYGYWEDFEIVDPGDTSPVEFGGFYDELGREFAAEMFRRRDMIRFGTFTTKSWLSHRPNGDHRTVFPIPQTVVDTNPNLDQNPNY